MMLIEKLSTGNLKAQSIGKNP